MKIIGLFAMAFTALCHGDTVLGEGPVRSASGPGFFDRIPPRRIFDEDSIFSDVVVITLKETLTGSLMFGAGINSDAGLIALQEPQPCTSEFILRWVRFPTKTTNELPR